MSLTFEKKLRCLVKSVEGLLEPNKGIVIMLDDADEKYLMRKNSDDQVLVTDITGNHYLDDFGHKDIVYIEGE